LKNIDFRKSDIQKINRLSHYHIYPILFPRSLIYFLKIKEPTFLLKCIYEYYTQAAIFSLCVLIKPDQQIEAAGLTGSNWGEPCPKSATVNGQQTVPGPRRRVCVNLICCRLPKKVTEWAEGRGRQEAGRSHLSVGVMANAL